MTSPDRQPDAPPPAPPAVRFVTLEHVTAQGSHFDLMIDVGETLATWQFARAPDESPADGLPCARLADHRRVYLDYEGPISGGRGRVCRRDAGVCTVERPDERRWEVEFRGERLCGRYRLERRAEAWSFGPAAS